MLKLILRIILFPALMVFRLTLGLAAFIVSVSSAIIGLGTSVFAVFAVIEFCLGYWQNGFILLGLTFLVSPIGLPALANLALNVMDGVCSFIEGKLC